MKSQNIFFRSFIYVIAAIVVLTYLSGCGMIQHSYVAPTVTEIDPSLLQRPKSPHKIRFTFEFQRNGEYRQDVTANVSKSARAKLELTGIVKIVEENSSHLPHLKIIMNNVAAIGKAFGKGFVAGLSFGLAGQTVTDGYEFTAAYQIADKSPFLKSYKHAIYTTQGIKEGPPSLEPMNIHQAFDKVLEELLILMLSDLQRAGYLQ